MFRHLEKAQLDEGAGERLVLFAGTTASPEADVCHLTKLKQLLDAVQSAEVQQHFFVIKEETPILNQEDIDRACLPIKEETEELWSMEQVNGLEEDPINMLPFTDVHEYSIIDEEKCQCTHTYQESKPATETPKNHCGGLDTGCDSNWKKTRVSESNVNAPKQKEGEEQFDCDACGKRFKHRDYLKIHLRVHTGEKPFGCDVCGKRFTEKGSLKRHTRVHTEEKPFGCDVCGKRFRVTGGLKRHSRVHIEEKTFGCDACGKRCMTRGNLQVHKKVHNR
ncbi:oocyte zinc finger protein XlCOF19-like isoform X4 [Anabas testudineus]|uniref:oocyte zinc finger protein XlCOF19-like isoform X4 n=1 Tax=Anabas testudineus TaxID=64144 RepID=UPI000E453E5C|nr:oocyte zinc finger protein XlCOF19-like isoform X4 [Anabas testudineus]